MVRIASTIGALALLTCCGGTAPVGESVSNINTGGKDGAADVGDATSSDLAAEAGGKPSDAGSGSQQAETGLATEVLTAAGDTPDMASNAADQIAVADSGLPAKPDGAPTAPDAGQSPPDAALPIQDSGSFAKDAASGELDAAPTGADASKADAYVPDPIPAIDPEPPPQCAKAKANADYFQFLDNLCDEKQSPKVADGEFACPIIDTAATATLPSGAKANWQAANAAVAYEDLGLQGKLPAGLQVAVISIRRVDGVPLYRYLSNGTAEVAVQPWSTSKFLAAANAAVALRVASNYKVGLTAKVGQKWIGDLVTSLVNYDDSPYSSNSLGSWFHDIGGRAKANAMIGPGWLKRPAVETFGGNYGSASPADLGFAFAELDGSSVAVAADKTGGFANNLSMHTLAEALKRLVLHREEAAQRLPGIQWPDVRTLLYGAPASGKYGPWGGLSADTAIYLQSAHDIAYLDKRSQGQWRIFSKLGLGTKGQFVHVGYGCFPVLDPQGKPVPNWGREFVIAGYLASGGNTWAERDRLLAKAYRAIVPKLIDGSL